MGSNGVPPSRQPLCDVLNLIVQKCVRLQGLFLPLKLSRNGVGFHEMVSDISMFRHAPPPCGSGGQSVSKDL
jgi:hypothetical protein